MPEPSEVAAYEIGIRLTQALGLLGGCKGVPNSEIEAALLRLQTASDRLHSHSSDENALSRFDEILSSCIDTWLTGLRARTAEQSAAEIDRRLGLARDFLLAHVDRMSPAESGWLRLGLAIADGYDETWSPGQPTCKLPEYPDALAVEDRSPYPVVVFVDPVPPRWEWNDEHAVLDLIGELDADMNQLFKRDRAIRYKESEIFGELPFEYWGWHAIEFGLESIKRQRVRPRWDAATRTLYLGHSRIHRYANPARNQTKILRAFEQNEWCTPIECPFADAQTANRTVADLARKMRPSGLHFLGGIQGIRWEYLEPTSDS